MRKSVFNDLGRAKSVAGLILLATMVLALTSCDSAEPEQPTVQPRSLPDGASYTTTETGLMYYDFVEGDGAVAPAGRLVEVNYRGWLEDGTLFDSSYARGQRFTFNLGAREVILGWDEGVEGMRIGGDRQLVIPPELGYGDRPRGTIPANSTLIFEVELTAVANSEPVP